MSSPCPESSPDTQNSKASLTPLLHLVEDDLKAVNRMIVHRMQSPVSLIPQLASHLIASGGKRIRPLITLASTKLCGYEGVHHITLAACVEFIHSATLLHDDVVDESTMRRGVVSAHEVWGNQESVLVGDFLFSRAFQLMVEVGSLEILSILSSASASIAQGEVLQLLTAQNLATTQESYLEVVTSKTARLFEAASEIGAVLAERSAQEREALANFGRNLGIAFQLVDDALDYSVREAKFGKNAGDDFREGKMTLPVVYALERASPEEKAFWKRTLGELQQKEGDFNQAIAYMTRHKTLERTLENATCYAREAQTQLRIFSPGPFRMALEALTSFVIDRTS
ncbi:MAG: polyprenyl synthetase family protein [Caedimonas sp.]|jgi:octaprenyl-diphosphate synthase|nr:polyprenyl synthetase family protein [Caedimonas sp.]